MSEVRDELIDLDMIERVATGEGHYLGEAQTLARMRTEYVYPHLGDRPGVDESIEACRTSIWDRTRNRVAEILGHGAGGPLDAGRRPGHPGALSDKVERGSERCMPVLRSMVLDAPAAEVRASDAVIDWSPGVIAIRMKSGSPFRSG